MPIFSEYSEHIGRIANAAIQAADPERLVQRHLHREDELLRTPSAAFDLQSGRLLVVSVGKAAVAMATAAANVVDQAAGIAISKAENAPGLPPRWEYFQAGHPIPTRQSVDATQNVARFLETATGDDFVLCLISGGTSAMLTAPLLPLDVWQEFNTALLNSGCSINDFNHVRQHFDSVKGGGLARWAVPAPCAALILSDVIGNRLEHIGSGPTVPIRPNVGRLRNILAEYEILDRLSQVCRQEVIKRIIQLSLEANQQTTEADDGGETMIFNNIIGNVSLAANAAMESAGKLGFAGQIDSVELTGEARNIGRMLAKRARDLPPDQCIVFGGESTVFVRGTGTGGRNQEMALAAAIELESVPNRVVACFSTDAEDGPTPVAGAVVSRDTLRRARELGLDANAFLDNNDSYTFFRLLGEGHITAPTGTNVNDIGIILSYSG